MEKYMTALSRTSSRSCSGAMQKQVRELQVLVRVCDKVVCTRERRCRLVGKKG